MSRVEGRSGSYWVSFHESLGLIIYDPWFNPDPSDDFVTLFKAQNARFGEFEKDVVCPKLLSKREYLRIKQIDDPDEAHSRMGAA